MATSEFSTGKTVFILAVVVGCFAVLWPKVFYPMMQAAFTMTTPRLNDEQVCCEVISESKIDLKFFAELCKSVIDREMATNAGIRKYRRERYPPPGMMERCRKKILELCDIDISEALVKSKKGKFSIDLRKTANNDSNQQPPPLNLTECLEKHFQLSRPLPRRFKKERALPSHIKQERPSQVGPQVPHPALTKRGSPFHSTGPTRTVTQQQGKPHPMGSLRPSLGGPGKTGPSSKGGGAMGFIMPIYTVGIVVFFLYTITKVLFRKPEDQTPKVMDFHMDPEYRKYVLSEEYENGVPLSYRDYLKRKEKEEHNKKGRLLGDQGRKQVFTAIEGIIAEMDDFRDKLMAEQSRMSIDKEDESLGATSEEESRTDMDGEVEDEMDQQPPITEEPLDSVKGEDADRPVVDSERTVDLKVEEPVNELAEQLKLITGDSKIAILGMETQAEFHEKTPVPEETQISNIILETSVPCDTQLLVAESQCETHTSTDHIEGWSDFEDQPVVVTGKMTISLLGKEASVHSTESKTSKRQVGPAHLESDDEDRKQANRTTNERRRIEELANALVEDILHNQVPKVFESALSDGAAPDMDTFELLPGSSAERRREFGSTNRISPRRQFSRESLNSQGSSFEYVSACQDESQLTSKTTDRHRSSLSPSKLDADGGGHRGTDFELMKNGTNLLHQQHNGSSLTSFECISAGSASPLASPECEMSFEKVQIPEGDFARSNGRVTEQCETNHQVLTPQLNENQQVRFIESDGGCNQMLDLGQYVPQPDSLSPASNADSIENINVILNAGVDVAQDEDGNNRFPAPFDEEDANLPLSDSGAVLTRLSTATDVENPEAVSGIALESSVEPQIVSLFDDILATREAVAVASPSSPHSLDPSSDQSSAESVVSVTEVHRPDPAAEQFCDNDKQPSVNREQSTPSQDDIQHSIQ